MSLLSSLHHVSLIVADTQIAIRFYRDILGLEVDRTRPDLGYPGAWLGVGQLQIHLLELPNPDSLEHRPAHGGRDRHTAFAVPDLDRLMSALDNAGVPYSASKSGRRAVFCRDPDANALEFVEVTDVDMA